MNTSRIVGIAQLAVCRPPEKLTCLGLGSCVAIIMLEPALKIGGIVHVLLPKATGNHSTDEKYADTGTRKLYREMISRGALEERLVAKLAGGAQMFTALDLAVANIGRENGTMARKVLGELGVRIVAEDLFGHRGRNIVLDPESGLVTVQTTFGPTKVI